MSQPMRYGRFDTWVKPFIYNFRPGLGGNLARWYLAKAKMRAEGYRPRIVYGGTSKVMNLGGGTALSGQQFAANAEPTSRSRHFAKMLADAGIPTNHEAICGIKGLGTLPNLIAYDPRLARSSSAWAADPAYVSIGGAPIRGNGAATETFGLTLPATMTFDRVQIYYFGASGSGVLRTSDNAGVIDTTDTFNAGNVLSNKVINMTTRGTGKSLTWNRQETNVNPVFLQMAIPYDSQSPAVDIINAGISGSMTATWKVNAYGYTVFPALRSIGGDLGIFGIMTNDMAQANNVLPSTWKANIKQIITQWMTDATGTRVRDAVIEVESLCSRASYGSAETQAAYVAAAYEVADELDIPLVDLAAQFGGSYSAASGWGVFADTAHENARGNALQARLYADLLAA